MPSPSVGTAPELGVLGLGEPNEETVMLVYLCYSLCAVRHGSCPIVFVVVVGNAVLVDGAPGVACEQAYCVCG